VVKALAAKGIEVSPAQVAIAARVISSQPDPPLQILAAGSPEGQPASAAPGQTRSWIKLGCRPPAECLPFYALVTLPAANSLSIPGAANSSDALRSLGVEPKTPVAMRAGAHAMLVLDRGESRIEISVVALECGRIGNKIRVATPDYKQFYRAEVVSASLLKGAF
jgi:hypothetical protein